MPIIVPGTGSSPTSTLTAQDIVDCSSQDIRKLLASSGTDAPILVDYVNRISLDIMRSQRWRFLLSPVKTFNTVADEPDYFIGSGAPPAGSTNTGLGLTSVRAIKADSVIDGTNNILLHPSEEKPILDAFNDSGHPKIWRLDQDTSTVLNLYPPPDGVYAIEFRYYEQFNVVDELTDNLQIPEDYKDVMCAGVNWLASKYLKQDSDAQHWFSVYQQGKVSMIGDYNHTPRVDFMRPDGTGSLVVTDVRTSLP